MSAEPRIFICYRREDSLDSAHRLCDSLRTSLGENWDVFIDLDVPVGADIRRYVTEKLRTCSVLLVVIGPQWLTVVDDHGDHRLDHELDFVRLEIATAFKEGIRIIPLLIKGARMPRAADVPPDIAALADLNAPQLSDGVYWRDDVGRLTAAIVTGHATAPKREPARRRGAVLAIAAALLLLLAGAAAVHGFGSGTPRPAVKVGAIYPLSGIDKSSGQDVYDGVRFAVQYINDGGIPDLNLPLSPGAGLPGLGGAKIQLVPADSRGDRCTSERLFGGLVRRGASAVIGAYESTVTLQAIYAADSLHVPLVNESSTAPSFTRDDRAHPSPRRTACGKSEDDHTPSPWFFRVGPDESQAADRFERFLRRRGGVHRIAVLHETSDIYGDSVYAVTKHLGRRLGLKDSEILDAGYPTVLGQREVKRGSPCTPGEFRLASRLASAVEKVRAFEPDVLFLGAYKADAVATLETMRKLDYEPPPLLAYGAGYEDKNYITEARLGRPECDLPPADPYGVITRVSWSLQLNAQRAIAVQAATAFEQRFGTAMNGKSSRGFTAMMALAEAISHARSTDPAKIRRALADLDVPAANTIMPWAGIRFDDAGQNTKAQVVLEQQTARGNVVVFPHEYQTGHAVSIEQARRP